MDSTSRPPLRSYKPRRRALGADARLAYDRDGTDRRLDIEGDVLDLTEVFGRSAPVVFEIGFGGGESLVELAARQPERDVIGADVHRPGVARVLRIADAEGLSNVRVVEGDALVFLDRLPDRCLDEVRVFFPDPWPKTRHHKRRLVAPDVIARLVQLMAPDARLHLATDSADYAQQMDAVCGAEPQLRGGRIDRPDWRPVTRYERRGLAEGRAPIDLCYERVTPV